MSDGFIDKPTRSPIQVEGSLANLLFIISVVALFGVVLATAGLFLYKQYLIKNTADLKDQVAKLENDLRPDLINQLLSLDQKLSSLKGILANHISSSNVFGLLEQNTLPQVHFTAFSYLNDSKKISLKGETTSYATVAQQVRIFEAVPQVASVSFGGLATNDKGVTNFVMDIIFKPSLVQYQTK
ncbi:MAG: hypothetical protein HY220_00020 [Candidatus Sungbacteria bacterium]|uniref:PilN domain-containing protein n=1 Tax=Candidatus Sungiibacteriota bacterium TaxID=2750080 RepID=A0A9D6QRL9_9BACT|nr:hypothetical protein [Candidatus Sungbacteria bacterium]